MGRIGFLPQMKILTLACEICSLDGLDAVEYLPIFLSSDEADKEYTISI